MIVRVVGTRDHVQIAGTIRRGRIAGHVQRRDEQSATSPDSQADRPSVVVALEQCFLFRRQRGPAWRSL